MSTDVYAELARALSARFGSGVIVELSAIAADEGELDDAERAAIAQAKGKRRTEFATGRRLAHRALAQLGAPACSLTVLDDRRPSWPHGFVGSISHTSGLCVVVVADHAQARGLGIDVELDQALKPELFRMILSAEEQSIVAAAPEAERGGLGMLHFSAKECLYKAQYPITQTYLEFGQVTLAVNGEHFSARVDHPIARALLPDALHGFVLRASGWVLSGMRL